MSLLPELRSLLCTGGGGSSAEREPYVAVAVRSLRLLLGKFGSVIRHGLAANGLAVSIGTDVEADAR